MLITVNRFFALQLPSFLVVVAWRNKPGPAYDTDGHESETERLEQREPSVYVRLPLRNRRVVH